MHSRRPNRLQRRAARHHMRRPPGAFDSRYGYPLWPRHSRRSWYQSGFVKFLVLFFVLQAVLGIWGVPFGTGIFWILILLIVIYFLAQRRQRGPTRTETPQTQSRTPYSQPQPARYPTPPPREISTATATSVPQQRRTQPVSVYIYPEKTQYTSSTQLACFSCRKPLSSEDKFCTECGKSVSRCKICRGVIAFGDVPSQCPHCQNEFHQEHIREWLKVSADCPVCRIAIKERELVAVAQSP